MRNPIKLLRESPSYIFGRFQLVRGTYAKAKRLQQRLSAVPPAMRIGERYGSTIGTLQARSAGRVQTSRAPETHIRELKRDAFSPGLSLSPETVAELGRTARCARLSGVHHDSVVYPEVGESSQVRQLEAILALKNSAQLSVVQEIAGDPILLDVVISYLGYVPARVSSWMFWSISNNLSSEEREARFQTVRFHYDVHGFNFLYVNFYLTAADARSGAHVLVRGTHRNKRARRLLGPARIDDADAIREYGEERIEIVQGAAGTGFFEDTSCYHKALIPLDSDRLMLQLRYQ